MVLVQERKFAWGARGERLVGALLLAWGARGEGGQMSVVVAVGGLVCYPRQP